jgi:hypothetical protein
MIKSCDKKRYIAAQKQQKQLQICEGLIPQRTILKCSFSENSVFVCVVFSTKVQMKEHLICLY